MKREVLLTIEGTQFSENYDENVELKTFGSFFKKGDHFYIIYQESEVTGFEGTTTTLKIEPGKVTMRRFGQTKTTMIMDPNNRHICRYPTPAGFIGLGISGVEIDNKLSEHGGEITIRYALDYENAYLSDHELRITVKEACKDHEHDTDSQGTNSVTH